MLISFAKCYCPSYKLYGISYVQLSYFLKMKNCGNYFFQIRKITRLDNGLLDRSSERSRDWIWAKPTCAGTNLETKLWVFDESCGTLGSV